MKRAPPSGNVRHGTGAAPCPCSPRPGGSSSGRIQCHPRHLLLLPAFSPLATHCPCGVRTPSLPHSGVVTHRQRHRHRTRQLASLLQRCARNVPRTAVRTAQNARGHTRGNQPLWPTSRTAQSHNEVERPPRSPVSWPAPPSLLRRLSRARCCLCRRWDGKRY